MKGKRPKASIGSPILTGELSWDQLLVETEEEKAAKKQFKESVKSYIKNPRLENRDRLLTLASEAGLDSHPLDWVPPKFYNKVADHPTYLGTLLKGKKDSNRYIRFSKALYELECEEEAIDYLKKGIEEEHSPEKHLNLIRLRESLEIGWKYIGADRPLKKLISKAAKTDMDILIEGETGTGKEIVANLIIV